MLDSRGILRNVDAFFVETKLDSNVLDREPSGDRRDPPQGKVDTQRDRARERLAGRDTEATGCTGRLESTEQRRELKKLSRAARNL